MEEWKECKLGDFFELHRGYDLTKSEIKTGPYPVVCSTSIMGYHSEYKVRAPGVVIGRSGTLGEVQFIDKDFWPHNTSLYVSDFKGNSPKFIKYFLQLFGTGNVGGGSAVPTLNRNHLQALAVKVPPLPIQQKIAAILSSLDDKIELNNKINTNLEQQAQALFKNWFVDNANNNLFTMKQLAEVTENLRDRITNQTTPVLSAVNTGKLQRSDEYFSKQVYSKDISKYILVKEGDFAYNPARVNIGSIGINDLGYDGCVSPVYVAFSVDPDYRSFFKYFIKSNKFKEEAKTRATGSVRQTLNYSDFAKIEIKYPPRDLAKQFEAFHSTIEASKRKIEKETETLISIRDTLLPKLMNGEIEL